MSENPEIVSTVVHRRFRFRFRFISIAALRLKITENEQQTDQKAIK